MWIFVLLLVFIAFISTPASEAVEKTWFTKVTVRYENYYIFKVAFVSDGRMFLGIYGSWILMTRNASDAEQSEISGNEENAQVEYERAIEFKKSKLFNKAAKAFSTSAQLFSSQGNHFQAGKAYEESYKSYKMVLDTSNSMDSLNMAIDEYMKHPTSHSIAARHCITLSKSFTEAKRWDESIRILQLGIQLLTDLEDDRVFAIKGDLGDLYAEKNDLKNASLLFKEIIPFVMNFSREKYIFRDLLCLALLKKWDEMDKNRQNYIELYPAFKDSASDEFIKSIFDSSSDFKSINALILGARPGFIPLWALRGV